MGNRTATIVVGEDIPKEMYDQLKDAAGDIYVLEVFEAGTPTQTVLPKDLWLQAKDMMDKA
jgi:hypothetical protein